MISSRLRAWMWCAALLVVALGSVTMMQAQDTTPAAAPPAATQARPQQFYLKLVPPRPTFATDMTPHEQELMQKHAAYWADQFKTGKVLILGPVMDPRGVFGIVVVECTEAEAHLMADGDPTVKAGLNHFDVMPMHVFLHK